MAVYSFSTLSNGQAISFDPFSDVLNFDQASISAASLSVSAEGSNVRTATADKSVVLQGVSPLQLATSNVTFANGSLLLFGDNSPGTAGDNAANALNGAAGNDLLQGFGGNDTLNGGAGNDSYIVSAGDVVNDTGGIDTIFTDVNFNLAANIENLTMTGTANVNTDGNALANVITGNAGNNIAWAGGGNDTLTGGAGNDLLGGDGGNDWLDGGLGNDTLDGGGDKDHFALDQMGAANADQINSFATNWDDIQLDIAAFGALGANGRFASGDARFFAAAGATAGHDADDRIVYNTSTGQLFYDADGSGSGSSQLIATLQNAPTLAASDINVFGTPASTGVINGTAGDDTLVGTPGNDTINGLGGNDSIYGLGGNDSLTGGDGNDTLDGGTGIDTMDGGLGDDTYFVDTNSDVLRDAGGIDTVVSFTTSGALPAGFENLVLRGGPFPLGNENFTSSGDGNDLDNVITNQRADNTGINGHGGDDTLLGGNAAEFFWYQGTTAFGRDLVDGGAGFNSLLFQGLGSMVTVDFGSGTATSPLGSVSFTNIEQAVGTSGNDLMTGGATAVRLWGELGNDTLTGGAGSDFLYGDEFFTGYGSGAPGNDSLSGGAGDDQLVGGVGDDFMDGGSGNDSLLAGSLNAFGQPDAGSDTLNGGTGVDTLEGGGGTDQFIFDQLGPSNADHIRDFASGTDKIELDANAMPALGASGDFAAGDARFFAAAGATAGHDADDRVVYDTSTGNLWYDADGNGAGAAQLIATLDGAPALAATDMVVRNGTTPPAGPINGTPGNDTLVGTPGNDTINGLGGNDSISGLGGNDVLDGGSGVDTLDGGAGNDSYYVTAGDVLSDSSGVDTVLSDGDWSLGLGFESITLLGTGNWQAQGFNADNLAIGNGGNNYFNMRDGNDTVLAGAGNDTIDMSAGGTSSYGNDSIDGGSGFDRIDFAGFTQTGIVVNLTSGTITGGGAGGAGSAAVSNIERVVGDAFNDSFTGSGLADMFDGNGGNDTFAGGQGNDTLTGGADADSFVFRETGSGNADTVGDFASGTDQIHLDATVLTALGTTGTFAAGDARFFASGGASAGHDADDRVIYDASTGNLWYDADGNGAAASQLIATLLGPAALAATDIFVDNGTPPPPPSGTINGTPGSDSLVGTSGDDTINGLGGNDSISGLGGDDVLDGGSGTDTMDGGAGNDTFFVTSGDVLTDSGGTDTVVSAIAWNLGAGFENLTLTGTAHISGGGNNLANVITQNAGNNTTWAGQGNDTVLGGGGNDYLGGDGGNDWLDGQSGNDTLDGGGDKDHFVFSSFGAADADTVRNFATAWDDLQLDHAAFTAAGAVGRFSASDGRFFAGAGASGGHDADDRLVYNTGTGQLWYDDDGSGAHSAQLVATLQGAPTLAASDINIF